MSESGQQELSDWFLNTWRLICKEMLRHSCQLVIVLCLAFTSHWYSLTQVLGLKVFKLWTKLSMYFQEQQELYIESLMSLIQQVSHIKSKKKPCTTTTAALEMKNVVLLGVEKYPRTRTIGQLWPKYFFVTDRWTENHRGWDCWQTKPHTNKHKMQLYYRI